MAKKKTKPVRKKSKASAPPDAATKRRAMRIYCKLEELYPDATCALTHSNPFQLLVATILSAQCTDKRVNMVTPALFKQYPDAAAMAKAKPGDLEELIKTTGFFRNKAKSIKGASQKIAGEFNDEVPHSMDELLTLPGVARKTANVVLGNAFNINVGIVVDTHIGRLSQRMGFTEHKDPKKIEQDLMRLFPQKSWTMLAHLLIFHGRAICSARKPQCEQCTLKKMCPQVGIETPP